MDAPRIVNTNGENGATPPAGKRPDRTFWLLIASASMLTIAAVLVALVVVTLIRQSSDASPASALTPAVAVSPDETSYGTMLTVAGQGWRAGEEIAISIARSLGEAETGAAQHAGARAGGDGTWQVQFPLLPNAAWPIGTNLRVIARGMSSGAVSATDLRIVEPPATDTPIVIFSSVSPTATDAGQAATSTATPTPLPPLPTPTPIVPTPYPSPTMPTPFPTGDAARWRGEYYSNPDLASTPFMVRNDAYVDFDWGRGAPVAGMPADDFSVRWTRSLFFDAGTYRFHVTVDDGVRLWIDGQLVIDEWNVGSMRPFESDRTFAGGHHIIVLEYFEQFGKAAIHLSWAPAEAYPDWKGEYFGNPNLDGAPLVVRNDPLIDFDWGQGAPADGLPADRFSVRWTRSLWLEEGAYRFRALVDDGMRLWVDGHLVIDRWRDGSVAEFAGHRYLATGQHQLQVEYYDNTGRAVIRVSWEQLVNFPDWRGEYYPNLNLGWPPEPPAFIRNDEAINFDWSAGPPEPSLPRTEFSVRWTKWANFGGGLVRFHMGSDDGIRVWLDGKLIADRWQNQPYTEWTVDRDVPAGVHEVRVEYYQWQGHARALVWWELLPPTATTIPPTSTFTPTALPTATSTFTPTPAPTSTPTDTPGIPPTSTPTPITWPTVTPEAAGRRGIRVTPLGAQLGQTITVVGVSWPAGIPVKLGLIGPEKALVQTAWLDEVTPVSDGSFVARLVVDPKWRGRDGVLVVARASATTDPATIHTTWLPLGREVSARSLQVKSEPLADDEPSARVYASEAEWQNAHPDRRLRREPVTRKLLRFLGRVGIRIQDPIDTDSVSIAWDDYIVAEVYLGPVPANSMTVEIIGVARTERNVQVVLRVAPPAEVLAQSDLRREIKLDYPRAAVLIPREELPTGVVPFAFITTAGQRLPQFRATL